MPSKRVPLSPTVAVRFAALRVAIDAAAAPFTKDTTFALSPDRLNDLPEARREAERLMMQHSDSPVAHSFVLTAPDSYAHELRW